MISIIYFLVFTIILIVSYFLYMLYDNKENRKAKDDGKRYVLEVRIFHEDGGVSSHLHGWTNKWVFTYDEALEKKENIKDLYDEVEILEYKIEPKMNNE